MRATRPRGRLLWAAAGGAAAVLALGLAFFRPPEDAAFSLCLFRRLVGIPCPGCGLTRAAAALLHGEWARAWAYHPAAPLLALEATGVWLLWGRALLAGRPFPATLARHVEPILLAHGAALAALWTGRLASGTLPW